MKRDSAAGNRRVYVVSELYYPEETSTGFLLTKIAEGLAAEHSIHVLCGQPTYSLRGVRAPRRERRCGVEIERCWGTTWNKDRLLLRLCNLITISVSIFLRLLRRLSKGDRVLVVTNPPLLPFVTALACRLRGAKFQLLIHDVYPDVMAAAGMLRRDSRWFRILDRRVRRLYCAAERIIVLGRDMKDLVRRKLPPGHNADHVTMITNWADVDLIRPQPRQENRLLAELGLLDRFIVQYAGNMGRSHNVEAIAECIERLRDEKIHFLLIGWGAKQVWLEDFCTERNLTNVTFAGKRPRSEQPDFLNACDVSLITFVPGMSGVSVPSRMYNVLASGKPIIAMADVNSELARVVHEERVGWVVPPDDVDALVEAIRESSKSSAAIREMGQRGRVAAETKYRLDHIVRSFAVSLFPEQPPATAVNQPDAVPIEEPDAVVL